MERGLYHKTAATRISIGGLSGGCEDLLIHRGPALGDG